MWSSGMGFSWHMMLVMEAANGKLTNLCWVSMIGAQNPIYNLSSMSCLIEDRLLRYFAKFTWLAYLVHFAKWLSLHSYLAILLSWLYKFVKSTLSNCKVHIAKSALPSDHLHIAKSKSPCELLKWASGCSPILRFLGTQIFFLSKLLPPKIRSLTPSPSFSLFWISALWASVAWFLGF
jgi:hypothetical protein